MEPSVGKRGKKIGSWPRKMLPLKARFTRVKIKRRHTAAIYTL